MESDSSVLADVRQFFTDLLVLRSAPLNLNWIDVTRTARAEQGTFVLSGHTRIDKSPVFGAQQFWFKGLLKGDRLYLSVHVGKRLIDGYYPAGFGIARHRFPPLAKMVETWSKNAIFSELQRLGSSENPIDLFSSDASLLIRELVGRNVKDAELVAAVYESTRFDDVRGLWLQALLAWLPFRSQLPRRQEFLTGLLNRSLKKDGDCGGHSCAHSVFSAVARERSIDFQKIALDFAASALAPASALNLGSTSASSETLQALERINGSQRDAHAKDFAIRSITRRMQSAKNAGRQDH